MRQTLLRIWLEQPWAGLTKQGTDPELLGACWVWILGWLLFFAVAFVRKDQTALRDKLNWLIFGVGLVGISLLGPAGILPKYIPIFGYGAFVLLGFLSAMGFANHRAKQVGFDHNHVMDVAFWILIFGIGGGRLAYLIQYGEYVFSNARGLPDMLFRAINLAEGGLVLIGALVGGTLGFLIYCLRKKVNPFEFADILMPGVFIGIGFGRIGCLMNGCCFGDRCEMPWAITFPHGSVTFNILVERGFVDPDAAATIPLHPTQIYSSINGFVLALVTGTFYWYRRYAGDVFALSCILYPITRFQLELLRSDEMGQLGTGLTISQLYSIGIFLFGVGLLLSGPLLRPAVVSGVKSNSASP